MFYKVLLPHESLTLPLNDKKERFEIILNIDPNTLWSDCFLDNNIIHPNALELSCIGIDQRNYGVEGFCITTQALNAESNPAIPGMEWLPTTRRDKPGSRVLVIEPQYLTDAIQKLWVIFGVNTPDTEKFKSWPKGSVQIRCGFQTWEWQFPDIGCTNTLAFQPLVLEKLRNTWRVHFVGKTLNLPPHIHNQNIMTPPTFQDASFSSSSINTQPHSSTTQDVSFPNQTAMPEGLKELYSIAVPYLDRFNITPKRLRLIVIIDFSVYMEPFFASGDIGKLLKLFTGLAAHAQYNGEFEVFLAAKQLISLNSVNWETLCTPDTLTNAPVIQEWIKRNTFNPRLNYGQIISEIRKNIYPANQGGSVTTLCQDARPTWVISLVSHDANDNAYAQWQLRWASYEPIFLQFLAVTRTHQTPVHQASDSPRTIFHKGSSSTEYDFSFLHSLSALENCMLPNTDFAALCNIPQLTASALYSTLIKGYGEWLQAGIKAGALEGDSATAKKLLTSVKNNIFD
ncbi:MAG: VWA domain-containing protein [Pseudomonadota bacterium]